MTPIDWVSITDAAAHATWAELEGMILQGRALLGRSGSGHYFVARSSLFGLVAPVPRVEVAQCLATIGRSASQDQAADQVRLLTLHEAAARVRVGPRTLRSAIRCGALSAQRTGKRNRSPYRIAVDDLLRWHAARQTDTAVMLGGALDILRGDAGISGREAIRRPRSS